MGIQLSKRDESEDDIISQKSLESVKGIIAFLKEHAREEGLFRRSSRHSLRKRILNALKKGEKAHFDNGSALECAAALRLYLCDLKKPVIPLRVQELMLADNPGVEAREVARDALGLIRQDLIGRHGELLAHILGLLNHLALSAPPSELHGSPLPITLLPVFFNLGPADLVKWRQVAVRFNELINEAPVQLGLHLMSESSNVETIQNSNPEEINDWRMESVPLLYPLMNLVNNNRNIYETGESTRVSLAPLRRPPPSRLHLAISNQYG
ncbi:uncharacterized protein LOC122506168 [Leptopilina heterotoma]|uniref:uncharacterized protein LOC122506168 n=1 Tax=Leptopilina heterotoma TaxID=63436 RepID=UPI001CA90502|nr:uncharacterized protein LOC122506168 [Leptopilina heterotoma]